MYKEVMRFMTMDGKLFASEDDAIKHSQDLLGQDLEALVSLAIPDATRSENFRAVMTLLQESNREELKNLIHSINEKLRFTE